MARAVISILGAAGVAAGGWLAGAAWAASRVSVPAHLGPAPAMAAENACIDPAAMRANAELVNQLRHYKDRLVRAERAAEQGEARSRAAALVAPPELVYGPEAWLRMSRSKTLRLKMPCSSWDAMGSFAIRHAYPLRASGRSLRVDASSRANAAGFTREELLAVAAAYERAHARTWAAMKPACESNEVVRTAIESGGELDDEDRVSICASNILDPDAEATRSAVRRMIELRAHRGTSFERPIGRRSVQEESVLLSLTESPLALWDEIVGAVGREKATAAVDYGLLCTNEAVYFAQSDGDGA